MKQKIYVVSLISKSVQTKLVQATSKREAIEIANNNEWQEKEEMLDSTITAKFATLPGNKYADFHPSDYVETADGCLRYEELGKNRINKMPKFYPVGPTGVPFHPEEMFNTRKEAEKALDKYVEGYKRQGYYSLPNMDRIPYPKIREACSIEMCYVI